VQIILYSKSIRVHTEYMYSSDGVEHAGESWGMLIKFMGGFLASSFQMGLRPSGFSTFQGEARAKDDKILLKYKGKRDLILISFLLLLLLTSGGSAEQEKKKARFLHKVYFS